MERFGLDYCCNGQRPLTEATSEAGLDLAVGGELSADGAVGSSHENGQHCCMPAVRHGVDGDRVGGCVRHQIGSRGDQLVVEGLVAFAEKQDVRTEAAAPRDRCGERRVP